MIVQEVIDRINKIERTDDLLDFAYKEKFIDNGSGGFDICVPSEAIKIIRDIFNDYMNLLYAQKVGDI